MRKRHVLLMILGLVVMAACGPLQTDTPPTPTADTASGGEEGRVVSVIDGDTIDVLIDGVRYRVRYIGINTPERDEVCYDEATDANAALVRGQTVTLVPDVSDVDRYDRLLRYVYLNGMFVNEALVRDGYAEAVEYPPDTSNAALFNRLEREAREADRGCHPTGVFD